MKRFIYFLSFLLIFNSLSVVSIDQENNIHIITTKDNQKTFSLYACYFIAKEICKASIFSCLYDDTHKDHAKIACSKCNYIINGNCAWTYLVVTVQENSLQNFMNLVYYGSIQELSEFILTVYQDRKVQCDQCFEYNGWHLVDSKPISKS